VTSSAETRDTDSKVNLYIPFYLFGFVPNNGGMNLRSCSFYLGEKTKAFKNIFNLLPFFGSSKYLFFPVRDIKLSSALICAVQNYFLNSCYAGKHSASSLNLPMDFIRRGAA